MGCDGVWSLGLAHGDGYGLELEPRPKHVDGGPHALHASHPHGHVHIELAHLAASILNKSLSL